VTRMFSYVSRLGASIAARTAVVAILIAVLAGAASAQVVVLNPTSLTFAASQGSTTPQSQNVE